MNGYTIRKVLVPIDFSAISLNALQTAVAICKRQLATLTLLHVVESSYTMFPPEAGGASAMLLPKLVTDANDDLGELANELRLTHDLVVNHIVQSGNPADEICRWASHKECDLIVMGTHGASGLSEFLVGTTAFSVVKNSPSPVLTIPGENQWIGFKKILFPIRMVPNALNKYDIVRPIIRKNGSSLLVAGIVKKDDPTGFIEMKALVDVVRHKVSEDDVMCKSEIHYCEDVAREVLNIADREKPDLIVITATLDTTIREFFLGQYTQNLVNHARYPVLSIRPDQVQQLSGVLASVKQAVP